MSAFRRNIGWLLLAAGIVVAIGTAVVFWRLANGPVVVPAQPVVVVEPDVDPGRGGAAESDAPPVETEIAAAAPVEAVPVLAAGVEMHTPERAPDIDPGSGVRAGCVLGYGKGGQCLTVVPPSHAHHPDHGPAVDMASLWTCSEVTLYFEDGIAVNGSGGTDDPLGLDSNNDGTACGPGDVGD